jgi:ankyrin repeat protein
MVQAAAEGAIRRSTGQSAHPAFVGGARLACRTFLALQLLCPAAGAASDLHIAAESGDLEAMRRLLATQPSLVDARDSLGWTALHHAVAGSNADASAYLLESGADVHARGPRGETPLLIAASPLRLGYAFREHPELTAFYRQWSQGRRSFSVQERQRIHALEQERNGRGLRIGSFALPARARIAGLLMARGASISSRDVFGNTVLHLAAGHQGEALARAFLDAGAPLDARNAYGWTPLHLAADGGGPDVVALLVQRGAGIAAAGMEGRTPLHSAVMAGNAGTAKALIDLKAPLDAADAGGWTALHFAAVRNDPALLALLIEHGAAVDIVNRDGFTPLHNAAERNLLQAAAMLLKAGASANSAAREGRQPVLLSAGRLGHREMTALLIEKGASLSWQDADGAGLLHHAARFGQAEIVALLLKHGASPLARDRIGNTALHYAADFSSEREARRKSDAQSLGVQSPAQPDPVKVMELLLEAGLSPNAASAEGHTPLHYAVFRGSLEQTRFLVQRGAHAGARDAEGRSPVDVAQRLGHMAIVEVLQAVRAPSPARR